MAFYTEERLNENRVLSDADFNVGFTDYLGATIRDAWHDNPTVATVELGEVYTAQVGRDAIADIMGDSFDTETDVSEFEPTASPALSLEDQQARIKEAGLEKHIKAQDGYNAEALNLIMDSKREELERQITRQAASDWYAPAGFIAGLGTSMLDPINLASNFIPGVGQTRALRMLQQGAKEGAKGLALSRAAIGAAEGAVGSVVVEPLVALARSQQQADYGMTDSLLNVAFGTVMGATLHPAIGAWGDYKRKQAQKDNPLITAPWETVAPTDRTEELRHQFAQDAFAKAREVGASMTEEQAYASAALFDARARTWAYFEKADPEEYYKQYRPVFKAELERMGGLEQGMYRNKADVPTFIENARNGMYDAHPSYVGMGEVIGGGHRFDGFELQLFSDNAKHTAKHEDNWENTLDIVTSGEFYDLKAKARTTGNESFLYYKHREDGKIDAVVVSPRSEKNKTLAVISSWKTNENGIEAVVQRAEEAAKRKAASVQPTGGSPAYPSQQRGALTGTETAFDDPSQTDAYILTGRGGESPQGLPTGYEGPSPLWERAQSNRSSEGTPSAVSGQSGVSESNIPQTGGDINTLLQSSVIHAAAGVEPDTFLDPTYIRPINKVTNEEAFEGLVRRFTEEEGFAPNTRPILVLNAGGDFHALTGSHRIHAARQAEVEVPAVVVEWDSEFDDAFMALFEANDDWDKLKALRELHELGAVSDDALLLMEAENESNAIGFKLYQIIGEKGAARLDRAREETVRTDNLAVAVKMAAEGKDDITIRLATGWEQGVDGKWRYEIPDGRLDFSGLKGKVQTDRYTPKGARRAARLKDVLIMPDLYAAYPEIANIRVFTQTLPRQEHAAVQMYSDGTKVIVLNSRYAKPGKPTEAILSNIVHEVQHVIQSAEGFIQGSNPKKAGGFERYEQVAGEAEARNAEGRIGFSEEERRNFLLSSTSDVSAGDMRTPDGKPLRDPRLPVEPVGPLIGREPRHALPEELPEDYDLGLPPEMPDAETPRGAVTFNPEDGKAVITFFKNTDASTLPHEMFHIFRRELAETAGMEGSSPQSKDMWAKVCEFVGAKEGEPWTRKQEEMFARAGERYLLEGEAPNAQLRGVFERMKQWFMEIYTGMDAAGMEISDTMRQVFGDMFKLSPEEADMAFRYGFGKMLEWDGSEGTDTAVPELPESDDPAMQEELTGLAAQRLEESLQGVADRPEFAEAVRKQVEQEIAELDAEMAQAKIQGDVLLEAALCDMRN